MVLIAFLRLSAQDPSFSQFSFNDGYFNPANVGNIPKLMRFSMVHRTLWPTIPNIYNYHTSKVTFLGNIVNHNNSSILKSGIIALMDVEGQGHLLTNTFTMPIGFKQRLGKKSPLYFLGGLGITLRMQRIDYTQLDFNDQYHPVDGLVADQSSFHLTHPDKTSPDPDMDFSLGTGFVFEKKEYEISGGLSVAHPNRLHETDVSLLETDRVVLPANHTANLKCSFRYRSDGEGYAAYMYWVPEVIFQNQGDFQTIMYGCNVYWTSLTPTNKGRLTLGAWHRLGYNTGWVSFMVGVRSIPVKNGYMHMYYNADISTAGDNVIKSLGGHEVGIIFETDNNWQTIRKSKFGKKMSNVSDKVFKRNEEEAVECAEKNDRVRKKSSKKKK